MSCDDRVLCWADTGEPERENFIKEMMTFKLHFKDPGVMSNEK